jgi:hypothetical protein
MKRCSASLIASEVQIKTAAQDPHTSQDTCYQDDPQEQRQTQNTTSPGGDVKLESCVLLEGL